MIGFPFERERCHTRERIVSRVRMSLVTLGLEYPYGVATISRLLKNMSLLQDIMSLQGTFAKETYNFKEPSTRSHPIGLVLILFDNHIHTYT